MGVKVVQMYPGRWYVRVVYNHFRKTKHIGSKERAHEVGRRLTTALELYGSDALRMFENDGTEAAARPAVLMPTIGQYQEKWLAELEKIDVTRSTKENYGYLVSRHVVPAFGKERLDAIDYQKLKAWVIGQSGKYSKDTVNICLLQSVQHTF